MQYSDMVREIDKTIVALENDLQRNRLNAAETTRKIEESVRKAHETIRNAQSNLDLVAIRAEARDISTRKKGNAVISTLPEDIRAAILAELLEKHPNFDLLRDLSVSG